jgi:hypothetical protein
MKRNLLSKWGSVAVSVALVGLLAGCGTPAESTAATAEASNSSVVTQASDTTVTEATAVDTADAEDYTVESGLLAGEKLFSGRDLTQTVDTSSATQLTLANGEDLTISEEGVYVVSGTATDASVIVDADDAAKGLRVVSSHQHRQAPRKERECGYKPRQDGQQRRKIPRRQRHHIEAVQGINRKGAEAPDTIHKPESPVSFKMDEMTGIQNRRHQGEHREQAPRRIRGGKFNPQNDGPYQTDHHRKRGGKMIEHT